MSLRAKQPQESSPTWSTPPIERRRKTPNWSVEDRPGGLKTYRALTPYERANEGAHFSVLEQDAALQLLRDLEFSGSMRVVVSHVYDGMPYTQSLAGASLKSQAQWAAAERLEWIWNEMALGWRSLLSVSVLGVVFERKGQPWSLEELGARLSRYRGRDQTRAFLVGLMKGALMRLAEAYAKWPAERHRREAARKLRQQTEEAKRPQVVDLSMDDREADAARKILLREYRKVVLGLSATGEVARKGGGCGEERESPR